ncbi:low molecular weight protein-tyrosine-phosphatase [Flavobacterium urocaniciphilum]|uniref:protein-tyrosine-phosphatase n=1 Tax=Flavobacterium urocaniciphilum TaxID=1299341 RepID=A0A1H8YS37_9FLAO|nr:low molecular weight protein-tyrosine-phosphatase [Flavobacterium urocaniciphilum]SEP54976.1 protein-tyrosine phosphatase [Flavobacterium urocaniciphilum]
MPTKVLMVCLGNICRSPLAEGILQSKLSKDICLVDSAGTGNWHAGEAPDKRSIAAAKNHGLDISQQRCRQIKQSDFSNFDYIYVMDNSNYTNVLAIAPSETSKSKVKVILNELHPNQNLEVPDPYWGNSNDFENVYQILDEVCEVIAQQIKSKKITV